MEIQFYYKALKENPKHVDAHYEIAALGIEGVDKTIDVEFHLKEYLKYEKNNFDIYEAIASYYFKKKEYKKALNYFNNASEKIKKLPLFKYYLKHLNHNIDPLGDQRKTKRLHKDSRKMSINPLTEKYYNNIVNLSLDHGTQFFAIQYAGRNVDDLKGLLHNRSDVKYVDTKTSFDQYLKEYDYDDLYVDFFAGNFGHMTDLGKKKLAQIISKKILSSYPTGSSTKQ